MVEKWGRGICELFKSQAFLCPYPGPQKNIFTHHSELVSCTAYRNQPYVRNKCSRKNISTHPRHKYSLGNGLPYVGTPCFFLQSQCVGGSSRRGVASNKDILLLFASNFNNTPDRLLHNSLFYELAK